MNAFTASMCGFAALATLACATASGEPLRSQVSGYELEVLVDGSPAPTFNHQGETYVMGRLGDRYVLRVHNHSGRRIEAVVSVDGRDAVDGKTADFRTKRGYLVPAYGFVDIDGWRLSQREAAAFRFSSVADSYAARTGSARNVGVIGVAVFPERAYTPRPRPYPVQPYYGMRGDGDRDRREYERKGDYAPAAPPASAPAEASGAAGRAADGVMSQADSAKKSSRPGLGTEFGEATYSPIHEVAFVRASSNTPSAILGARYNSRDGLIALGIDVDGVRPYDDDLYLRGTARPFQTSSHGNYATPPGGWRRW
jgi:hypothetical protein